MPLTTLTTIYDANCSVAVSLSLPIIYHLNPSTTDSIDSTTACAAVDTFYITSERRTSMRRRVLTEEETETQRA